MVGESLFEDIAAEWARSGMNGTSLLMKYCRDRFAVIAILGCHACLLAWSALAHSPVVAEVNHLSAGLSHLYLEQFNLFRVNPPLVRMVAALPVTCLSPAVNWSHYDSSPLARSDLDVSREFLEGNGVRSLWFFVVARWACIPFSVLGGYICFRWARELYGTPCGLVALLFWCSCPYILGHASLFSPDAHSAAMGVAASYLFWQWLRRPEWMDGVFTGIVLGLAQLTKFTLLVFYPLWIVAWIVYRGSELGLRQPRRWCSEGGMLLGVFLLSILVINGGYGFEKSLRPLGEFQFQSELFGGPRAERGEVKIAGNRFTQTSLASVPVPLPANFVQGIDTQRLDFERGLPSYLRGQWAEHGWWCYYLYALAIKIPLGTWCLVIVAVGMTAFRMRCSASWRDEMMVMLPFLVILAFVSSQTGFSVHSRYVIPALPFLFVWTSKVGCAFERATWAERRSKTRLTVAAIVVGSLAWSVGSSLWYYPHSLSYFSELVGGPKGGHEHLLDSNIAWGQDLFFLKRWCDEHPEARPLHLAFYGLMDPRLVGLEFTVPPVGPRSVGVSQGPAASPDKLGPLPGWYAIDMNHLHGARLAATDGEGGWQRLANDDYDLTYFQRFEPVATAGYSIYIYHITPDEANRMRRELGLPELSAGDGSEGRMPWAMIVRQQRTLIAKLGEGISEAATSCPGGGRK